MNYATVREAIQNYIYIYIYGIGTLRGEGLFGEGNVNILLGI